MTGLEVYFVIGVFSTRLTRLAAVGVADLVPTAAFCWATEFFRPGAAAFLTVAGDRSVLAVLTFRLAVFEGLAVFAAIFAGG